MYLGERYKELYQQLEAIDRETFDMEAGTDDVLCKGNEMKEILLRIVTGESRSDAIEGEAGRLRSLVFNLCGQEIEIDVNAFGTEPVEPIRMEPFQDQEGKNRE